VAAGDEIIVKELENMSATCTVRTIFKILMGSVVIWSLTSRDEHRLNVLGNSVLRRICGPRRAGETDH
jgi:hypothetical protein